MRASYKEEREVTMVMRSHEVRQLIAMLNELDKFPECSSVDDRTWEHTTRKNYLNTLKIALTEKLPNGLVP